MDYYSSYKKVNTPRTADPDILKRINKLKDEYDISPNALSFLSSLLVGYKKYGGITKKQYDAFCEIEKNYLHANSDLDATWFENYDDLKRETTKICALYYCANPPYYGDLAYRALYDKDFIPSERQYEALTQNKYAQKVLESHFSKSKFKVNDYVSLKKIILVISQTIKMFSLLFKWRQNQLQLPRRIQRNIKYCHSMTPLLITWKSDG